MKNPVNSFVFFLLIAISFAGCKKYEDGPDFITLRSIKNRLTNGKWVMDKFNSSGIDSTDYYTEIDFSFDFEKVGSDESFVNTNSSVYTFTQKYTFEGQLVKINGNVYFSANGNYIQFLNNNYDYLYYPPYTPYPPIFNSYSLDYAPYWKITKLTNAEFWLECTYNNGEEYSLKLKKSK